MAVSPTLAHPVRQSCYVDVSASNGASGCGPHCPAAARTCPPHSRRLVVDDHATLEHQHLDVAKAGRKPDAANTMGDDLRSVPGARSTTKMSSPRTIPIHHDHPNRISQQDSAAMASSSRRPLWDKVAACLSRHWPHLRHEQGHQLCDHAEVVNVCASKNVLTQRLATRCVTTFRVRDHAAPLNYED